MDEAVSRAICCCESIELYCEAWFGMVNMRGRKDVYAFVQTRFKPIAMETGKEEERDSSRLAPPCRV